MPGKKNWRFLAGAIFIVLGAGVSTFVPFFLFFFGIPVFVFIAGVILMWLSPRKKATKLLWTLVPICLFAIVVFIWYRSKRVTPETFLIPENYRGEIHVIFNEPCGSEPVIENGRRIYNIPSNGILITKFKAEYGIINQQYFIITSNGRRIALPQMDAGDFNEVGTLEKNPHEPSRDSLGVFNTGFSGTKSFQDEKEFDYQGCVIGTYKQLRDSFGFEYDNRFDSLEHILLQQCRNKK